MYYSIVTMLLFRIVHSFLYEISIQDSSVNFRLMYRLFEYLEPSKTWLSYLQHRHIFSLAENAWKIADTQLCIQLVAELKIKHSLCLDIKDKTILHSIFRNVINNNKYWCSLKKFVCSPKHKRW